MENKNIVELIENGEINETHLFDFITTYRNLVKLDILSETNFNEDLTKLGVEPEALARKGEEIYKAEYKGKALTYDQWIEAFVKHPVLIERPIIIKGDKAVIGRPIENIDTLLD